jgi:hypothetical protein
MSCPIWDGKRGKLFFFVGHFRIDLPSIGYFSFLDYVFVLLGVMSLDYIISLRRCEERESQRFPAGKKLAYVDNHFTFILRCSPLC